MNEFKININPEITESNLELVNKYWELDNSDFVFKPSQLKNNFQISQYELNKIISQNSECEIEIGFCEDCKENISEVIYSQTAFKQNINTNKKRCQNCEEVYFRNLRLQNELEYKLREQKRKEKKTELSDFSALENLTPNERDTLTKVVKLKERNLIFSNVFNDNYDETWKIVNKLEKMGLLFVERNENGNVLDFLFNETIEEVLLEIEPQQKESSSSVIDSYTFNIPLVQHNFQTAKSPKYSKGFKLPSTVIFEKNVEYLVGCWILTDGSLNITFTPKNKIIKSEDFILSENENDRLANETFPSFEEGDDFDEFNSNSFDIEEDNIF